MDEEFRRYRIEQARAYLESIARLRGQITALELRAAELREAACGVKAVAYDRDSVSLSPYGDAIPDAVASLEELADMAAAKGAELSEMVSECSVALESLGGWQAVLLDLHYLGGKSLVDIGRMNGWRHERRYMSVLHLQALEGFYEHMPHHRRDPLPPAL